MIQDPSILVTLGTPSAMPTIEHHHLEWWIPVATEEERRRSEDTASSITLPPVSLPPLPAAPASPPPIVAVVPRPAFPPVAVEAGLRDSSSTSLSDVLQGAGTAPGAPAVVVSAEGGGGGAVPLEPVPLATRSPSSQVPTSPPGSMRSSAGHRSLDREFPPEWRALGLGGGAPPRGAGNNPESATGPGSVVSAGGGGGGSSSRGGGDWWASGGEGSSGIIHPQYQQRGAGGSHHLLLASQHTGGGGSHYTRSFIARSLNSTQDVDPTLEWELDPSDMRVEESAPIASGAFGEVFKGSWRGAPIVCKRIKREFSDDSTALSEMRAELAIWSRLHHPNVCRFLGAVTRAQDYPCTLVAEYCKQGSLQMLMFKHVKAGTNLKWDLAIQCVSFPPAAASRQLPPPAANGPSIPITTVVVAQALFP